MFQKGKVMLVLLVGILLLAVFFELGERKNSFVKSWLYEGNVDKELQVATVVLTPDKDPLITRDKVRNYVLEIKNNHPDVDLIVFGEVIFGWFRAETREYHQRISEKVPGDTTDLIAALARENSVSITFGIAEKFGSDVFNSQVFINDAGEITNVQRKKNLKSPYFSPGPEPISFVDINGVKTGLVICYDGRLSETMKKAGENGADLIVLSNADYMDEWDDIRFGYKYLAKRYDAWIVTANRYGTEYETDWDGHVEFVGPFGDIEKSGERKEQYLLHNLRISTGQSRGKRMMQKIYSKASIGYLIIRHPGIAWSYL